MIMVRHLGLDGEILPDRRYLCLPAFFERKCFICNKALVIGVSVVAEHFVYDQGCLFLSTDCDKCAVVNFWGNQLKV